MSDTQAKLSIRILEKEYHITCPIEERSDLLDSAEFLNAKMREIRDTGKVVGSERIAVMAALNITHELLGLKSGAPATSGFDSTAVQRRISAMQTAIDRAMAEQDKLF